MTAMLPQEANPSGIPAGSHHGEDDPLAPPAVFPRGDDPPGTPRGADGHGRSWPLGRSLPPQLGPGPLPAAPTPLGERAF